MKVKFRYCLWMFLLTSVFASGQNNTALGKWKTYSITFLDTIDSGYDLIIADLKSYTSGLKKLPSKYIQMVTNYPQKENIAHYEFVKKDNAYQLKFIHLTNKLSSRTWELNFRPDMKVYISDKKIHSLKVVYDNMNDELIMMNLKTGEKRILKREF